MIALINTNRMTPPIAPMALDLLVDALQRRGIAVDLLDPSLAADPMALLARYCQQHSPRLVALSFRNLDDCFWPSGRSFLPELLAMIRRLRQLTDAPILIGGVGFSIDPVRIMTLTDAEYGIAGDGEPALTALAEVLENMPSSRQPDPPQLQAIPGLLYRDRGGIRWNPSEPYDITESTPARTAVANGDYFRRGGQVGLETKRGCSRQCLYCIEPRIKGRTARLRSPQRVAEEAEQLLRQGVEVLHLCDSEFNIPLEHAHAVCEALIDRDLGRRIRWYAYLAVTPFDNRLAEQMVRAGCVGINITADAASEAMLACYRHPHRFSDIARTVEACRRQGMACMLDMMLGGPGETPETVAETIGAFRQLPFTCAGAALGIRVYPHTPLLAAILRDGPPENSPHIKRHYQGSVDWLEPTFYLSSHLGDQPAQLVRELMAGDDRFFPPAEDGSPIGHAHADKDDDRSTNTDIHANTASLPSLGPSASGDHNYSDNQELVNAIENGARGAYWHILHSLRTAP